MGHPFSMFFLWAIKTGSRSSPSEASEALFQHNENLAARKELSGAGRFLGLSLRLWFAKP
jgi:hypothetical protein